MYILTFDLMSRGWMCCLILNLTIVLRVKTYYDVWKMLSQILFFNIMQLSTFTNPVLKEVFINYHSSDILPIWFKHTRIICFFWAFKKILENTWYKGQFSSLCIIIMFFIKKLKILLFEHLRKILVFRMSLLCKLYSK
jgi:hypothetical protein